jgi:hypothetical protein
MAISETHCSPKKATRNKMFRGIPIAFGTTLLKPNSRSHRFLQESANDLLCTMLLIFWLLNASRGVIACFQGDTIGSIVFIGFSVVSLSLLLGLLVRNFGTQLWFSILDIFLGITIVVSVLSDFSRYKYGLSWIEPITLVILIQLFRIYIFSKSDLLRIFATTILCLTSISLSCIFRKLPIYDYSSDILIMMLNYISIFSMAYILFSFFRQLSLAISVEQSEILESKLKLETSLLDYNGQLETVREKIALTNRTANHTLMLLQALRGSMGLEIHNLKTRVDTDLN